MARDDAGLLGGLEVLNAVVEAGNFVLAGRRLGLTQPGVSRAVQRLEERVGVRLFDRNARAVRLTEEGQRFQQGVAPLLLALREAVEGAAGSASQARGTIRVNTDAFFASAVLAPRLPEFLSAHPGLFLDLVTRDSTGNLVADGIDVALRFGAPEGDGLIARKLLDARIVTCASPAYLEAHGRPKHPRDLERGHTCIHFYDPRRRGPFEWEFHQGRRRVTRLTLHSQLQVNDAATSIAACVAGAGVCQPMELGVRALLDSGALVNLFPKWTDERFPLYALFPSRFRPAAKVRVFLDWVAGVAPRRA